MLRLQSCGRQQQPFFTGDSNATSLLVSCDFLGFPSALAAAVDFTVTNFPAVASHPANLAALSKRLRKRIVSELFSKQDVATVRSWRSQCSNTDLYNALSPYLSPLLLSATGQRTTAQEPPVEQRALASPAPPRSSSHASESKAAASPNRHAARQRRANGSSSQQRSSQAAAAGAGATNSRQNIGASPPSSPIITPPRPAVAPAERSAPPQPSSSAAFDARQRSRPQSAYTRPGSAVSSGVSSAGVSLLPAAVDDQQLLPYRAIDLFAASRQLRDVAVSDTARRSMRKTGGSASSAARSPYGRVGGGKRGGSAAGGIDDGGTRWWAENGQDALPQQWALAVDASPPPSRASAEEGGSSTVLQRRGALSASGTGAGADTVWRMRGVVHAMLQAWSSAQP